MPISLALLDAATSGAKSFGRIMRQTVRNPMLIGSALGVVVSLSGIELPPIVLDPLTLIANACVPIMLISYGISLHGQRVLTSARASPRHRARDRPQAHRDADRRVGAGSLRLPPLPRRAC